MTDDDRGALDAISMTVMGHYTVQLERSLRRERGARGARIINAQEFDRSMIELMQYVHARLPAAMAHAAIAAFMRGIFEGHGLVSYGDPS
jgi:hypothetical protein